MKRILTIMAFAALVGCGAQCDKESCQGEYEPTWESLSQHDEIPEWLQEGKLGIYFHWSLFSVPAFGNEWYPFYMYRPGNSTYKHHQETYGKDFNYHDFAEGFTAEHFDAREWAKLFKATGAAFAGPCAIHHDGFSMWDSEVNPWNAVKRGPKKDITGELTAALREEGLKTIATFHHARGLQKNADIPSEWVSGGKIDCGYNSHFAYDPSIITSTTDPELSKLYGNLPTEKERYDYWLEMLEEVIDQYSPDVIWFDSWLNLIPDSYRQEFAAYYYNEAKRKGQEVTIASKQADMPLEVGIHDIEQGGRMESSDRVWMTDVTLSNRSWSYIEGQTYKSAGMVLQNMIDVWSKNGVVLLNISPRADGVIVPEQREVMLSIGEWLSNYGEAVYGTVPHSVHGFGDAAILPNKHGGQSASTVYTAGDVRFTRSKDGKSFYAIFLGAPKVGDVVNFRILAPHRYPIHGDIRKVTLLGTDIEAEFDYNPNKCTLTIPDAEMNEMATVFKFELE